MAAIKELDIHEFPAFSLLQPLAVLIWELEQVGPHTPYFDSPLRLERALASGIIPVAACLLESVLRWFEHKCGRDGAAIHPVEILRRHYEAPILVDELEELFAVRNAVAHGHVWSSVLRYDKDNLKRKSTYSPFRKLAGYGGKSFDRVVNMNTHTTRRLGLPVIPTQINRLHAWRYLKVCLKIIDYVETSHGAFVGMPGEKPYSIVETVVQKGDKPVRFAEIIRQLPEG